MSLDEIERLVRRVERAGLAQCEVELGEFRLRLRFDHGEIAEESTFAANRAEPADETKKEEAASNEAAVLSSPATGFFQMIHPMDGLPFVAHGDVVEAGQLVAFLSDGFALSSVVAKESGTVKEQLSRDGTLVGYGCALVSIRLAVNAD